MEFKLPYYVSNGGDGSVLVHLCETLNEAETEDANLTEGWGESSAGRFSLKVENEKLYFRKFQKVDGKYAYVWIEVKEQ